MKSFTLQLFLSFVFCLVFSNCEMPVSSESNADNTLVPLQEHPVLINNEILNTYRTHLLNTLNSTLEERKAKTCLSNIEEATAQLLTEITSLKTEIARELNLNELIVENVEQVRTEKNAVEEVLFVHQGMQQLEDAITVTSEAYSETWNSISNNQPTHFILKKEAWRNRFKGLNVEQAFIVFERLLNTVWVTENGLLEELMYLETSNYTLVFDSFEPISTTKKTVIKRGEKFKSEISLGTYVKSADISVSVNGSRLPVTNGKAKYITTALSTGEKMYHVTISIKNPLTGKVDVYKKTFEYEVIKN